MATDREHSKDTPCKTDEWKQFDFWLGRWRVNWGEGHHGTNVVKKILGGCVIQEAFDGRPGTDLRGMSLSTFNAESGRWQQTWVDNHGGYLDFEGGWQGDRMILSRQVPGSDGRIRQRMVWFDIESDSLIWNWERSEDGGGDWQLLWQLQYQRLPED